MRQMPLDAHVHCSDGAVGRSTCLILDPIREAVTQIVVYDGGRPIELERVVPVEHIVETTHDSIRLDCTREELRELPAFDSVGYIPRGDDAGTRTFFWPFARPEAVNLPLEHERVPLGKLALRRGADIEASDGHVGKLGELLVDEDGRITHIVLMEGHLWGRREVAVPVSMIQDAEDDLVRLRVDRNAIEKLPAIPVKRSYDLTS
jgi:hypothetical protein